MLNPSPLLLASPTFRRRVPMLAPAEQSASRLRAAEADAAWESLFRVRDEDFTDAKERFARLNG